MVESHRLMRTIPGNNCSLYHLSMKRRPARQDDELIRRLSSRDPAVRDDTINSFTQSGHEGIGSLVNLVRNHLLGQGQRTYTRTRDLMCGIAITGFIAYIVV